MRSTSRNIICEKQPFGGGRRAVFLCAGMGSFAPPGASSFLSSLKESYQRKSLETTFQDFLARECAGVAPAGASLRRPHFFLRRKKCGKESRLDLRFKDPLARGGSCRFGGADLAELVRRVSLSVRGTACTSCAAAADNSEGRGWYAGRFWRLSNRAFAAARRQR